MRQRCFPQRWSGTEQAARAVVTVPRLLELKECLDKALRDSVGLLGCAVQELDWMILWVPSHAEYSVISRKKPQPNKTSKKSPNKQTKNNPNPLQ